MTRSDYEYRGLIAASWDLLRGDTTQWPDRSFFRDAIAESGQPVLDVGCGTGRLLLDYLADGVDIEGVDNSPEMLALCREKAEKLGLQPTLYQQEMEALDLPRKYRTIIVPSSSFQLVIDLEDASEAMKRFYSHLEPGGMLAMPFMILWTEPTTESVFTHKDWQQTGEKVRPEDGLTVRRWSRNGYDIPNQLEHVHERYELLRHGVVVYSENHSRSPGVRWYTQEQSIALYADAGFTDIRLFREFTQEPASKTDTIWTVVGKRP